MESIRELSRRIAEEFRPQRVVLFGSYVRGTPTPDSDVDLLIVMPYEGKSAYKSAEMRLKLRPQFPVDLIVRTPEAVRRRLEMGDPFMRDILKTGKVLYEGIAHEAFGFTTIDENDAPSPLAGEGRGEGV